MIYHMQVGEIRMNAYIRARLKLIEADIDRALYGTGGAFALSDALHKVQALLSKGDDEE